MSKFCRACVRIALLSGMFLTVGLLNLSAADPDAASLAVVTFVDWEGLQKLRPLGLNVIDLQEESLAAVVMPGQIAELRTLGPNFSVLDTPASPDLYYLVGLPPSGQTASLYSSGEVFPYVKGSYILKAEAAQVEMLSGEGYFIKSLVGPVVLPSDPPYTAAKPPEAAAQAPSTLIQMLVNSVSETSLNDTIRNLQDNTGLGGWDAKGSRYSYSSQLAGKRDYIRNRIQSLDLPTVLHHFTVSGTSQHNIEGSLAGWGPGGDVIYIVGAHYDSISDNPYNIAPGADDNASGIAGVLEAARVLTPYRFKRTLRFLGFAAEEQGLFGSQYYAAAAQSVGTNIDGMIDLDMIAWDSDGDNRMDVHAGTRQDSQNLGAAFLNSLAAYAIDLQPQYVTSGASRFSDHSPFWDRGYPAVMLIEDYYGSSDFNDYYHTTSDTLDKLRLPYARKFVQATVATLADLAQIIPPGLRIEHDGPGLVLSGTQTASTVHYSVPGPDIVHGAVITETLSQGLTFVGDNSGLARSQPDAHTITWQLGDLAPYTRASFAITVGVASNLRSGQFLTSTVEAVGAVAWDDTGDNRAIWCARSGSAIMYLPIIGKESPN